MTLTIRDKADTLGTFRFVSVHLMETLARWVPTTPELEIKTLFGRHIWDLAQHADLLGKRTFELRAALHYSRRPTGDYWHELERLSAVTTTTDRIANMYDVLLPDLAARYESYLREADPLLDEPSVRVLDRIVADFPRLAGDRAAVVRECAHLGAAQRSPDGLRAITQFVDFRPATEAAATEAS
jgi:hypothetical protein